MTVGDFFLILVFDRLSLIVFHVFFMSFLKRLKHNTAGLWVSESDNGAFHYSNAHSNFTVRWPIKTEHSAFKAVVTRVTLP